MLLSQVEAPSPFHGGQAIRLCAPDGGQQRGLCNPRIQVVARIATMALIDDRVCDAGARRGRQSGCQSGCSSVRSVGSLVRWSVGPLVPCIHAHTRHALASKYCYLLLYYIIFLQCMLPRLRKDRNKSRVHPRGRRTNLWRRRDRCGYYNAVCRCFGPAVTKVMAAGAIHAASQR